MAIATFVSEHESIGGAGFRMNNEKIVEALNSLTEVCMESRERFRVAAQEVGNNEFRRLFNVFTQQRAQFISELQAEVHRLGGPLIDDGKLSEAIDRARASIRTAAAQGDEAAIIADCQAGEDASVCSYRDISKTGLPLDVQYVVRRQYMDIKDAYDRLRILERAA
jgi:uncharacterized protein (TIGR02284 family)